MVATVEAPEKYVGKPLRRREDPKLMTGEGNFIDDVRLPGLAHAAILRSPVAHAKIRSIDTSRARKMPGVIGVFTGEDFADVNPLPCAWQAAGVDNNVNTPRVLALGEVRQVGDPVAAVVAESVYQANDALEAIDVDYDELPVVVDTREAIKPGAHQIYENAPNNVVMHWNCGTDAETVDRALADAEVRVSQSIFNQRLIPTAMEPRGSIGLYDPGTDQYTLWATSQAPHVHKLVVAAFVLGIPEQKIRVIAPDVGGGFGSKIFMYFDMPLMLLLSKKTGRPVKFFEDRTENYLHTTHGRDHHHRHRGRGHGRRQDHGSESEYPGEPRRLPLDGGAGHPDHPLRPDDRRLLQDPGHPRRREGRLHQHGDGRRLSRRRPAGGDVRHRARLRPGGGRHRG